jgi:hypothetical protein
MKIFLVNKPGGPLAPGTFVAQWDDGFEIVDKKEVSPGRWKMTVRAGLIIPHTALNPYVVPVNLTGQFAYEDGKAWAINPGVWR